MRIVVQRGAALARSVDWWLIGAVSLMLTISLAIQYSFALNEGTDTLSSFYRHATFVGLGILLFVLASGIDYRALKFHPAVPWAIAALLLIAVLLFGTNIKGTTGWFVLGGFSFQPVELCKLLLVLAMAAYFGQDAASSKNIRYVITGSAATAILILLVFLQPDLGSAIILFSIWFGSMLVLRIPKWFSALVMGTTGLAAVLGWFFLFEQYQKDRLTTFLNPAADPLGTGYNITQSIIAVGSGSLWGRGLGLGTQSQLHFLPEATSDFVFAVVAEELGLLGVAALFMALIIILYRLIRAMRQTRDHFAFVYLLGICIYLFIQSTMVIGMNSGILPVTGVPLPLMSTGGTSMLVTLLALGIGHNIIIQTLKGRSSSSA